jgi:DNA polymerase-4
MSIPRSRFRKILHIDLDAFFCTVEELLDPGLKGVAFAVGGSPEGRGVVTSCSYPARQHGVHSAMPMKRALKIFPQLRVVRGHFGEYIQASNKVMALLGDITPKIEQISIDEAFLDVTDLPDPAVQIARQVQHGIFTSLGLPCSIGVASNKLMAKIATNIGKSTHRGLTPPMAILEVPPGREAEFLRPLLVGEMWGIGPKTTAHFEELGLHTIGDIFDMPLSTLVKHFGKFGYDLAERARGVDEREVSDEGEMKSVSNEITFAVDIKDEKILLGEIQHLSTKVGVRLRKHGLSGFTVRIKIRWPDFTTHTRQLTLPQPTNSDSVICKAARQLFHGIWRKGLAVRLIGVGVSQLSDPFQQLSLFDHSFEKEQKLLRAVDELHKRFGDEVIHRGAGTKSHRNWKE